MLYRLNKRKGIIPAKTITICLSNKKQRRYSGSVMPFVAVSIFVLFVTLGISTDFMRDIEAASQLRFAAQTGALYGLSLATNQDGSYSSSSAQTNISNAILNPAASTWNIADAGPQNNVWSKPVSFSSSAINFVNNPDDGTEFFLQLTASRQGTDALLQFFLPLAYANFSSSSLPLTKVSPVQTIEVLGQPASRIGAAVPKNTTAGTRASNLIGFATLPLAISNLQFAAATTSTVGTPSTIDLVSSNSNGTVQPGHIKGCFVNLSPSGGSTGNYYGGSQGSQAFNQLIAMLSYFTGANSATIPTNVECGSLLSAYDPSTFSTTQQSSITQAISPLPQQFYIVPVLMADPNFSGFNTVVGFARLQLQSINMVNGNVSSITMNIGESVPVRNASSATGFSAVSNTPGSFMPGTVAPFLPRQYDSSTNGIAARVHGLVLAQPCLPESSKGARQVTNMLKNVFTLNLLNKESVENTTTLVKSPVAPMVAVLGAKGGTGATSIAINLATAFATLRLKTSLIDANLQQPDVANTIGIEPKHSLLELLARSHALDQQVYEACCAKFTYVDIPLVLLSPPVEGDTSFKANLSLLAQCVNSIKNYSEIWVLDLPRHIDKHLVTLLDQCDRILLVFEATMQGVAACRRWLNVFAELGYGKEKVVCVLNRSGSKYSAVEAQINQHFLDQTIFRIPNASSLVWQSSAQGVPIVSSRPKEKYSQAMFSLARLLNHSFLEE